MTNISHFNVPTVATGSIICANKISVGLMATTVYLADVIR
jgi:hypothetical protein